MRKSRMCFIMDSLKEHFTCIKIKMSSLSIKNGNYLKSVKIQRFKIIF